MRLIITEVKYMSPGIFALRAGTPARGGWCGPCKTAEIGQRASCNNTVLRPGQCLILIPQESRTTARFLIIRRIRPLTLQVLRLWRLLRHVAGLVRTRHPVPLLSRKPFKGTSNIIAFGTASFRAFMCRSAL